MKIPKGPAVSAALGLLLAWGCASPPAPPGPGESRGGIPDLQGSTLMVLPIQEKIPAPQGVTADLELAHALRSRGGAVDWVFPQELDEILGRSPGVPARIRGLPVQMFRQAEVNRIGDPLFGNIVRLAGLCGADVALLPVDLRWTDADTYTLSAALVIVRSGRVAWYGVVEGAPGQAEDPATVASVTEALARVLLPFG